MEEMLAFLMKDWWMIPLGLLVLILLIKLVPRYKIAPAGYGIHYFRFAAQKL